MRLRFREVIEATNNGVLFIVLVFDVLDADGNVTSEYRYHTPDWTFEMRAAEYGLDSPDEAMEFVLGEAVMLFDPSTRPADDGPVFGQPGVSAAAIRNAHRARCRHARDQYELDARQCRVSLGSKLRFDGERINRLREDLTTSPLAREGGRG